MLQRRLLRQRFGAVDVKLSNSRNTQSLLQRFGAGDTIVQRYFSTTPSGEIAFPEGDPVACFIGRLVPEKGVDVLLKAFARVVDQLPKAKLLIVGTGADEPRLRGLCTSLNLDAAVSFRGYIANDDLGQVYSEAHVQVIPSIWPEPFGIVAREAMSVGRAVIATRGGGLEETVEDGKTGRLVNPGDVDDLAQQVFELLSDLPRARQMGHQAFQTQMGLADNSTLLDQHLAHYRRAIGG